MECFEKIESRTSLIWQLALSVFWRVYSEADTLTIYRNQKLTRISQVTTSPVLRRAPPLAAAGHHTGCPALIPNDIVTFCAKWLRPHSRLGRSPFIMYSRHPDEPRHSQGTFFNEKEAKLVCLVLPAGCHYGPLESSLRESAGPIVPKVPRTASWGAWLPLSTFTTQTCLRDRFPRQRHWRATYFFPVLCRKRQARRGYLWVHLFRPFRAIG